MSEVTSSRPQVNGILETSLYVERPTRSVEFYRRVFGFEPIDPDQKEGITDQTRLCAMRAGDRNILLLFKKGTTADTDATGSNPHRIRNCPVGTTSMGGMVVAAGDYD